MKKRWNDNKQKVALTVVFGLVGSAVFGQTGEDSETTLNWIYGLSILAMVQLLLVTLALSALKGLINGIDFKAWKKGLKGQNAGVIALLFVGSMLYQNTVFAAGETMQVETTTSMSGAIFWLVALNVGLFLSLIYLLTKLERYSRILNGEDVSQSAIERFSDQMVGLVPLEKEKDILLDHDYDGIHELDNNLPPWWLYMFYVCILFGVGYIGYYHVSGTGKLQIEEYTAEMEIANAQKAAYLEKLSNSVNEENVTRLMDETSLKSGRQIFIDYCATCHRKDGGGMPGSGPNLTDPYWKHGGGVKNVFTTVKYGVPEKGMIAWKDQFTPGQIQKVVSYLLTLQGSNPENAKAPEGDLWEEE